MIMQLNSNLLTKIAVPTVLFVAIVVGIKSCSKPNVQNNETNENLALNDEELTALGISGDTQEDTMRTLVARLRSIQETQEALKIQNDKLLEENSKLKVSATDVDNRISRALTQAKAESDKARAELQNQQKLLENQFNQLKQSSLDNIEAASTATFNPNPVQASSDIPAGLGINDIPIGGASASSTTVNWIEPQDGVQTDRNGKPVGLSPTGMGMAGTGAPGATFQFPTSFGTADKTYSDQRANLEQNAKGKQAIVEADPVYTLPENSTLVGSRGMTALLGRVPIEGKVTDPYPFKIMIGKDNLTANGIQLPDVQGAIVSGTATGDWTLSCVRGDVYSITFVFADGTVRTVPKSAPSSGGNGNSSNSGSIGWISDASGIPCIAGERKSNASTYLPTLFALSGAQAGAEAFAQGQTTSTVDGGTITSALTGDAGQYALGKALSGGINESAEWIRARYGMTFDAVYVPPGGQLAVHITKEIPIDYESQGRKVKYDEFSLDGKLNRSRLD